MGKKKETRKFGKHTLRRYSNHETKASAEKQKKHLKKSHKYVRVTKMKHGHTVWASGS